MFFNEWEPAAAEWTRRLMSAGLIPVGEVDERSICDLISDDTGGNLATHWFSGVAGWPLALRMAGWDDDRYVATASCPCQPFSAAGAGEAEADERHLWPEFYRLANLLRPPVIFGEQVASAAGRTWWKNVRADLHRSGYETAVIDAPAAMCGAPHIRQRLYWSARQIGHAMEPLTASLANPWAESVWIACKDNKARRVPSDRRQRQAESVSMETAGWVTPTSRDQKDSDGMAFVSENPDGSRRDRLDLLPRQAMGLVSQHMPWPSYPLSHGVPSKNNDPRMRPLLDRLIATGRTEKEAKSVLKAARSNRTTRLKGMGNAVVPQLAARWIIACSQAGSDFQKDAARLMRESVVGITEHPEYVLSHKDWPEGIPAIRARASKIMVICGWPTPSAVDATSNAESVESKDGRGSGGINLTAASRLSDELPVNGWPTPTSLSFAGSHEPGNNKSMNETVAVSPTEIEVTGWPTPKGMDVTANVERGDARSEREGRDTASNLPTAAELASAKPKGLVLNAGFSRWLQGFPEQWDRLSPGFAEWEEVQSILHRMHLEGLADGRDRRADGDLRTGGDRPAPEPHGPAADPGQPQPGDAGGDQTEPGGDHPEAWRAAYNGGAETPPEPADDGASGEVPGLRDDCVRSPWGMGVRDVRLPEVQLEKNPMSALEKKTILRYETRIAELKRKIAAIDLQKQVYQSEIDKTQKAVEAIKGLEEPVEVPTIPIEWASPTNGQVREPACSTITSASDRACKEIDDGRGILESAG